MQTSYRGGARQRRRRDRRQGLAGTHLAVAAGAATEISATSDTAGVPRPMPHTFGPIVADAYLSAEGVSHLTPFSKKALEIKRARGGGPHWSRVGRRIVYRWADVVAWIEGGDK
jgi:hypothetical protein